MKIIKLNIWMIVGTISSKLFDNKLDVISPIQMVGLLDRNNGINPFDRI